MNDKVLGYIVLLASLLGIVCYFILLFISPWAMLVLQISAFLLVSVMLAIIAWIGYTLATTPPPVTLEDFELEVSKDEQN